MQSSSTYKERALAHLEGKWFDGALVTLVYYIIYQGISWVVQQFLGGSQGLLFNLAWMLLCFPLMWSFTTLFLDFIRGKKLEVSMLFNGYNDFMRIFTAYLIFIFGTLIGCMLFFIPGIIFALMYSQVPYILKDNSRIGVWEAFSNSAKMMRGHKMDLFLLYLSFIGWAILAVLTLCIGCLFLSPYINTTLAHYYEDLKKESIF